jgi:DNA-binding NarL/FixJ family response regulator
MIIRILLADDHALFQAGLRSLFKSQPDMEVIGEVCNGKDAVKLAGELTPDLIISDISMPQCNGTEAARDIKRRYPNIKILVLTVHKTEEYIHTALEAGADGYILKDDSQEELMTAIRSVMSGKIYLSPSICGNVVRGYLGDQNKGDFIPSWMKLSHRERQIIKLVAEGYRNKEIADYLSISIKTVEKHRSNLMKKLQLRSTSSLTAYAIEHGLAGG